MKTIKKFYRKVKFKKIFRKPKKKTTNYPVVSFIQKIQKKPTKSS